MSRAKEKAQPFLDYDKRMVSAVDENLGRENVAKAMRPIAIDMIRAAAARDRRSWGKQHLMITFYTSADGVVVSERTRSLYPSKITVALQHRFEDFVADEHGFSVTLWFSGQPERITVPYDAIISVREPSQKLLFEFPRQTGLSAASDAATRTEAAKVIHATFGDAASNSTSAAPAPASAFPLTAQAMDAVRRMSKQERIAFRSWLGGYLRAAEPGD